jgi:hypothetical protein
MLLLYLYNSAELNYREELTLAPELIFARSSNWSSSSHARCQPIPFGPAYEAHTLVSYSTTRISHPG